LLIFATDPGIANQLYAVGLAGSNGKIIKSSDGGDSWVDMYTEPSKSNPVETIAISKANSRIVLAGLATGENNSLNRRRPNLAIRHGSRRHYHKDSLLQHLYHLRLNRNQGFKQKY